MSPDLFRNRRLLLVSDQQGQQEEGVEAEWPSLQRLKIDAPIMAPSGRWYYTGEESDVGPLRMDWSALHGPHSSKGLDSNDANGDNGENAGSEAFSDADMNDDEKDAEINGAEQVREWRTMPDPADFNQLDIALAAAVKVMPRLKTCAFSLRPIEDLTKSVSIQCAEAGEEMPWLTEERDDDQTVRRWRIGTCKHTAWEVPMEFNAMCAEWAGPNGELVIWQDESEF